MSQWEIVEGECQTTEPILAFIPMKNLIINRSRISRLSNHRSQNQVQLREEKFVLSRFRCKLKVKASKHQLQSKSFKVIVAMMILILIVDLCFYNMGCGNQIGCLGPKPREREVYLDLIDKIYNEANSLAIDKKQEKYTSIKNHLLKKGLLRKLIDNLISHRANLQQCLVQNLEMAEASKNSQGRVTSLIIVDKIFDEMYKTQSNSNIQPNEPPKLRSSKKIQKLIQDREGPSKSTENYQNVFVVTRIFMRLILFLFKNDQTLYKYTANSLKKILNSKIEKLIWKGQIQNVFQFLIQKVKKHQEVQTNIELATMILKKINENLSKAIQQQTIEFLIKEWLNCQIEVIQLKFLSFFKEYFKNVQGQYQVLYESIMKVLDQVQFEQKKSYRISCLLNYFQFQDEGSKVFKKGLLNLLLNYLQIQFDINQLNKTRMQNYKNQQCKLNGFKLLTKWITEKNVEIEAIVEYNPTVIMRPYLLNIEKRTEQHFKNQLKIQLFKIISLLNQDSVIITINKICEQFAQKQISNHKRQFLLKLIIQLCDQKDNVISKFSPQQFCKLTFLINIENYYSKELKIQLIQFAILSLKRLNLKGIKQNIETNNLFLIKMCGFLYSVWQEITINIKSQHQQLEKQQSTQSKQKKQLNSFIFICRFIQKFQSFLVLLKQSDLKVVLISFIYRINNYIKANDPFQSQDQAVIFFIIQLLIQKTIHLLSRNIQIPEPVFRLSKKMEQNDISQEVRQQIIESARAMLKNQLSNVQLGQYDVLQAVTKKDQITFFINKNRAEIQNVQHICNISQEQRIQMDQTFKYYFCAPLRQKKKEENENFSSSIFNRVPSIIVSLDQILNQRMSPRNQGSESFMEIIQKMQKQ